MRILVGLLILFAGLAATSRPTVKPPYPQEFEARGCASFDGRTGTVMCKACAWIRTSDGWIVSCEAR